MRLLRALPAVIRKTVGWLAFMLIAWGISWWMWEQPFMERPRMVWTINRMPAPQALPMPVQGVAPHRIADTFGAPRGTNRLHEGVDIFARRGTPVLSTTEGIVSSIRETGLGGRQVWVLGPARQRHYYAHLDDWATDLKVGDVVVPGTLLGTVGDSGNARGTPPHLHYGIYGSGGAYDPLPLLGRHAH